MAKIKISSKVEQREGEVLQVKAKAAHAFLCERFETGTRNLEHLLPSLRGNLVRL